MGIIWDKREDDFIFRLEDTSKSYLNGKYTKRTLLGAIAGIFDPLGLISPIIVKLKFLFHRVCTLKENWDDPVPESIHNEWINWLKEAAVVKEIRFNRSFFTLTDKTLRSGQPST